MLAVAGLGKAFMNARNRNAMINSADANDGFRTAFTRPNMLDIAGGIPDRNRGTILPRPKMMTPQDMANDQMFLDAMAAKGGRIVNVRLKKVEKQLNVKRKQESKSKDLGKREEDNMPGKPISKSKQKGLAKLAQKKPELAKKFGYDPKRMVAKKGGKVSKYKKKK